MNLSGFLYALLSELKARAGLVMLACILIGLSVPVLAEALNHWLLPAFVVPLMLSIARLEWRGQWQMLKQWPLMLCISGWVLIGSPLLVWVVLHGLNLPDSLLVALVLAAAAPPLAACGALAFFLRLDANVAVVGTMITMAIAPVTLPIMAFYLLELELSLSLGEVVARLTLIVSLSFGGAYLLKRTLTQERIDQHGDVLDGIGLVCIGIFVIGIMSGITELTIEQPSWVALSLLATTLLVLFLNILGAILFWALPKLTSLSIGMLSGQMNLGLLYLSLQNQVPLAVLSVFAIGQIPLYVVPGFWQWTLHKFPVAPESGYSDS